MAIPWLRLLAEHRPMRLTLRCLTAITCLACLASSTAAAPPERPNIVLMMADNLGYGELGCYGGGILRGAPTSRIDALARQGLRLSPRGRAKPPARAGSRARVRASRRALPRVRAVGVLRVSRIERRGEAQKIRLEDANREQLLRAGAAIRGSW